MGKLSREKTTGRLVGWLQPRVAALSLALDKAQQQLGTSRAMSHEVVPTMS
jgi:hypothetical protein